MAIVRFNRLICNLNNSHKRQYVSKLVKYCYLTVKCLIGLRHAKKRTLKSLKGQSDSLGRELERPWSGKEDFQFSRRDAAPQPCSAH